VTDKRKGKLEAKDILPNINRTKAAELKGLKMTFLSLVSDDLDL